MYRETLFIICVFAGVHSIPKFNTTPCKRGDNACYTRNSDYLYGLSVEGDPSLNIESLNPMYQKSIPGKFATINYKVYNSTVEGFSNCHVIDTKLSLEKNTMKYELFCPFIHMYGKYDISGVLIVVPMEGSGDYSIKCTDYHIFVDTDIRIDEDANGQRHIHFKNFKALGDLRGGMVLGMTNLFNGKNKELADAALKFANTYWKPVAREFQGPMVNANVKKLIKNLNKYLALVPLDRMLID